ncbi:Hsp70 family protein [Rhodococcus triatomae]
MTVGHGIGLGVGNTDAIAILQSSDAPLTDRPVLVQPATLQISATAARLGAPRDEPGVISGFLGAVGDPDGLIDADGTRYLAEDLVATATASLIATASRQFPGFPADSARVAVHPVRWNESQVGALRAAFDRGGLSAVRLTSDAVAAAAWFEATQTPPGEGVVAVCDFGANGLTVSLVRTEGDEPRLVSSTFSSLFGADRVDGLLADHVIGLADHVLGVTHPDHTDSDAGRDLLLDRCRAAKERLSAVDAVTIPVDLGSVGEVSVTRSQFADLVREFLDGVLALIAETLDGDGDVVRGVLLTGGGAAIPSLAELAASALPAPVVVAAHPTRTAVHGAAILAAGIVGSATPPAAPVAGSGLDGTLTDRLPVVEPPRRPLAFTESAIGDPVPVAETAVPAEAVRAAPARDASTPSRRALVAAGIALFLLVVTIAGAAAATRGGNGGTTPLPGTTPAVPPAPAATTPARATATTTTRSAVPTTPRSATTVRSPASAATTAPPVATTQRPSAAATPTVTTPPHGTTHEQDPDDGTTPPETTTDEPTTPETTTPETTTPEATETTTAEATTPEVSVDTGSEIAASETEPEPPAELETVTASEPDAELEPGAQ